MLGHLKHINRAIIYDQIVPVQALANINIRDVNGVVLEVKSIKSNSLKNITSNEVVLATFESPENMFTGKIILSLN